MQVRDPPLGGALSAEAAAPPMLAKLSFSSIQIGLVLFWATEAEIRSGNWRLR